VLELGSRKFHRVQKHGSPLKTKLKNSVADHTIGINFEEGHVLPIIYLGHAPNNWPIDDVFIDLSCRCLKLKNSNSISIRQGLVWSLLTS